MSRNDKAIIAIVTGSMLGYAENCEDETVREALTNYAKELLFMAGYELTEGPEVDIRPIKSGRAS